MQAQTLLAFVLATTLIELTPGPNMGYLAVLTLSGVITVPHVLLLQLAQGVINAFDTPARQAFVSEMVEDRADLPNAIALNSSMVNAAATSVLPSNHEPPSARHWRKPRATKC